MKIQKAVFILFLFFSFSLILSGQKKVVTTPLYSANNQRIRIDKIEITTKATTLYCDIRSLAPEDNKVSLSSECHLEGISGKDYKLTASKGITLDESFHSFFPTKFTLTFEPLDKGEDIFHFYERQDKKSGYILSNIHTYKSEGVTPFKTIIKGRVIDIPECEYISIYPVWGDFMQTEFMFVKDGKFELEKEFNFSEDYYLYVREPNPLKGKGVLSTFYVEPGVIEITVVSKELGGNTIKGGAINYYPDFSPDSIKKTEEEKRIYAIYKELSNDTEAKAEAEAKKQRMLAKDGFYFEKNKPYLPWSLSRKLLTKAARERLNELMDVYDVADNDKDVLSDSIMIEMMVMERSPGFYADSVIPLIDKMKEMEAARQEKVYQYLSENANAIKNLKYLNNRIFALTRYYPMYNPVRPHEFDSDFRLANDSEYEKLTAIFELYYSKLYPYHPYAEGIKTYMAEHRERMMQGQLFFDACSTLIYKIPDTELSNESVVHGAEYEQFKKDIETALRKKNIDNIYYIERFVYDYAPKYPNHPITEEIRKIIHIAMDENNPNKWKSIRVGNTRVTGLEESMAALKANYEREKEAQEREKKKKEGEAKLLNMKKE
ncbi:MAG: hypothetical protein LBV43_06840 [Prevotella sp.]|nr:hypothetical protein [Prevotella sp.]